MADEAVKVLFGRPDRQLRVRKGLSREDFARAIGQERGCGGGVERGTRNIIPANIVAIAKGLGVPAAELLMFEKLDAVGPLRRRRL